MKKNLALICITAMAISLIGCGSKNETESVEAAEAVTAKSTTEAEIAETENTQTEQTTASAAYVDTTIYGKVTSIDGENITLALGDLAITNGGGAKAAGTVPADGTVPTEGQTPPDGEAPAEGQTPPDGEAPAEGQTPPDGEAPAEGQTPPDMGEAGSIELPFEENGETLTITADSSITIEMQQMGAPGGEAASETTDAEVADTTTYTVADLNVDSLLAITYDSAGAISGIQIISLAVSE